MTPIDVDRVQQIELRERRTLDRRARGLLAPSEYIEWARSLGRVLYQLSVVRGRTSMASKNI